CKPENIVLFGESLGTAVTGQLAPHVKCKAIVLQSPLDSVWQRNYELMPILSVIPSCLWPHDGFKNEPLVTGAHPPLLIICGSKDIATPVHHADRLFKVASEPKKYIRIEGAGHTGEKLLMGKQYTEGYAKFCHDLDTVGPASQN